MVACTHTSEESQRNHSRCFHYKKMNIQVIVSELSYCFRSLDGKETEPLAREPGGVMGKEKAFKGHPVELKRVKSLSQDPKPS